MDSDFSVDLNLPTPEAPSATTPFEFEYLCGVSSSALDGAATSTSAPSSCRQLGGGGGLLDLPDGTPKRIEAQQWPAPSLPHTSSAVPLTSSTTNAHNDAGPAARKRPAAYRTSQPHTQRAERVSRKAKGIQGPPYAVEKRHRSSLNEKFAALAQALSGEALRRICASESQDWAVQMDAIASPVAKGDLGSAIRQRKTATLSAAIETISLLTTCCRREARDLEHLRRSVEDIRCRVRRALGAENATDGDQ